MLEVFNRVKVKDMFKFRDMVNSIVRDPAKAKVKSKAKVKAKVKHIVEVELKDKVKFKDIMTWSKT